MVNDYKLKQQPITRKLHPCFPVSDPYLACKTIQYDPQPDLYYDGELRCKAPKSTDKYVRIRELHTSMDSTGLIRIRTTQLRSSEWIAPYICITLSLCDKRTELGAIPPELRN
ncbi:hypothetical protein M758_9G032200 [Ceratodon purpureus]|uniref:Uncharacterized protein n=1 Tax=Ceratodon purpureus TaxID=3225 RepID=A0A8T0GPR7_CERPU|nr:hypothetical protein KC19_9G030300 [Ceratodon purpureus]KAG0605110.1 hypothetical protein M758_9G032200 [Ceratodon purpureus]